MSNEYELSAIFYDPFLYPFLRGVRQHVVRLLEPYRGEPILDLCCGTGAQLKLLEAAGFTALHGLDLSAPMLARARRGRHDYVLYERDATDTGLPTGQFATVLLSFAIHEKEPAVQKGMMREAHRLLRPGGTLLVVDYLFDERSWSLSRGVITAIERIAGKEHYRNFRGFLSRGGLEHLLPATSWRHVGGARAHFGATGIALYEKVDE